MIKRTEIPLSIRSKSVISRFKRLIGKPDENGCWPWIGCRKKDGYGVFGVMLPTGYRTTALAHRVSFVLFRGALNTDLELHHECENKSCVNPNHTRQITRADHMLIGTNLAAINSRKTECPQGHPLSGDNLKLDKGNNGRVRRRCKICASAAVSRHWFRMSPTKRAAWTKRKTLRNKERIRLK